MKRRLDILLLGFGATSVIIGILDSDRLTTLCGIIAGCAAAIVNAIYSINKS